MTAPGGSSDPDVAGTAGRISRMQESARLRAEAATGWADGLRQRSSIVEAAFVVYERDRVAAGTVLGSAIAFRLFLFFVPAVLFMVGILGVVSGYVDDDTINESASITGALADQIRQALNQSTTATYVALFTGLFLMISASRSLAKALVASCSLAWLTGGNVNAKIKVVATIVGIVFSLMLMSALVNRARRELGIAGAGLGFGAGLVVYGLLFLVLMSALPRRTPDPGALIPGAALTSLVIVGMQSISQLYLPGRLSGASELYGGIGVAVVTLGWLFILGRTLSLSFSVNAALFDRFGSLSQGFFSLPLLRSLPRRSAFIRRYFGLDASGRSVEHDESIDDHFAGGNDVLTAVESLGAVDEVQPKGHS